MIETQLKDKVAIVTGANHGIGAAAAKALALQGVKVLISYLRLGDEYSKHRIPQYKENQASSASKVIAEIKASGGFSEEYEVDLAAAGNIPLLFDKAEKVFGPVEILVNNAAYCDPDTFDSEAEIKHFSTGLTSCAISAEKIDAHFAINARAVALMMSEFAKRRKASGVHWGRIVNISTDAADCFPTEVSYGASKLALESFSRSAAVELGKYGITVNIVSPGPIQTGWMTKEVEERVATHSPLGRIGTPGDVADVIVFLASEQARWLTGQRLFVGGGNRVV